MAEPRTSDSLENLAPLPQHPLVVWPTVAWAAACVAGWALCFVAGATSTGPGWIWFIGCAMGAYGIYIAVHDAAHGGVGRSRLVNEWLGRFGILLITPFISFAAFRYIHLQHHASTNEPGADPDMWAAKGRGWALPLRFATIDLGYYRFYLRRLLKRPRAELLATGISLALGTGIVVTLCLLGFGRAVLLYWILPGRVAIFFLAWILDYLPHRPHRVLQRDNAFRATNIRVGLEPWLSPLMLWQNYHLVHHLYPREPFWQMVRLWRLRESWHLAQGPVLVRVSGRSLSVEDYAQRRADHKPVGDMA